MILKEDFDTYGENSFEFKIVEKLKPNKICTDKEKINELKELLEIWIDMIRK